MKHLYKVVLLLFTIGLFYCSSINAAGKKNYPILILRSPGHFDSFAGEILKAEGFNEFHFSLRTSLKYLKKFDLVILPEVALTDTQKDILTSYVREGGNLIAFRPDKKLATIFGVVDNKDILDEGYISIDTFSEIGKGLTKETLQFHGTADL